MPAEVTRLSDYRPPAYLVDDVHLTFRLSPDRTTVLSKIRFRPNPAATSTEFCLDGEGLNLVRAAVDGVPVQPKTTQYGLTAEVPAGPFLWEAEVEIAPQANTSLEGLYMSGGLYCTQCEAEGFRKITYYPDRPDVMAPFTVRIEGDASTLLSNGDPVGAGPGWAEWKDPWPKPAYLFALVAGDLVATRDTFVTSEGRKVDLAVWTRPGDETKSGYALDALKRSMAWDEAVYRRAYDLSQFNIVAVDDFNAGAMENKGLNIFNAKYVLASPDTATDRDYELIEAIIAHEYFHNWTGNRITCRDWFQLCLKEGLTVFRDQQFSGDMRSHGVKRIDDVLTLRAGQFPEDAGPLAHPVRPEEYVEINNFYTATVYEKGAEVIGMLKTIVGDADYDAALALYFDRHDGQACTIEDWLAVFEDTTGRDLNQFKLWYSQAGTPRVTLETQASDGRWRLIARQETPPTPGQSDKKPVVIPIRFATYDRTGAPLDAERVVVLDRAEAVLADGKLSADGQMPLVSAFRRFSAPVIVEQSLSEDERLTLLANDTDPFNRWEAGRHLIKSALLQMIGNGTPPQQRLFAALDKVANDASLDPAYRAFTLAFPSNDDLARAVFDAGQVPDPLKIHSVRRDMGHRLAVALTDTAELLFDTMRTTGPYRPDAEAAGKRALRAKALSWLTQTEGPDRAAHLFETADNMTESLGALSALLYIGDGQDQLAAFEAKWSDDRLVMNKWFALQIELATPAKAVDVAMRLTEHPGFDWKNPNRFRSVVGALIGNRAGFHDISGAGYDFVIDWLVRLDPLNPQTTARMTTAFETWRRFDADRQDLMQSALERLLATPNLSRDTSEMVTRLLHDAR